MKYRIAETMKCIRERERERERERVRGTFGEGDNVVVLKAEAALAVAEALADDVTGGVLAPPFWVSSWDYLCICPALVLRL